MFQLLGYTLRPDVGYPLDAWRCEQTLGIFKDLVTFHGEQPLWAEFWICGGESPGAERAGAAPNLGVPATPAAAARAA